MAQPIIQVVNITMDELEARMERVVRRVHDDQEIDDHQVAAILGINVATWRRWYRADAALRAMGMDRSGPDAKRPRWRWRMSAINEWSRRRR